MKISAAIMAHPDRAFWVDDLVTRLDRPVEVHWDDEGAPSGNADRVWRQARATWLMHDPAADWHVLIQDDAVPCADFLTSLETALESVPPISVVSPYLGQGDRATGPRWARMAADADGRHASWVRSDRVRWGVCLALPVHLIGSMIERADRMAGVPDDMRVGGWAVRNKVEVWYPWPSLVDHRSVPSLTKHKAADRRAARYHDGSALDLAWTNGVVTDPMLTRRSGPRSGPSARRRNTPA